MVASCFLLIDGHSLAFRAYYAFTMSKSGALRTKTGIPTSVCFGFLTSLLQVIQAQKPDYLAIAFDRTEPTFRHKADEKYKSDRKETPEDFIPDLANLQDLLSALNLQTVTAIGYEADDVIGTLATQASVAGYEVKIVSGDRDLFQLVSKLKKISVIYLERNAVKSASAANYTEFQEEEVIAKLGVKPSQVVDYKALCGDKSDCIAGVLGIGEKTAVKLLQEHPSLEKIYENIEQIKGTVQKKLMAGKTSAFHSRYLAEIITDAPLELKLEDCKLQGFEIDQIKPLLEKLELNKFLQQINKIQHQLGGEHISASEVVPELKIENATSQQLSLFDTPKTETLLTSVNINDESSQKRETFPQITPQIITTLEQLTELIQTLKSHPNSQYPVAWDTETTALNPRDAELVGIGCCWGSQPNEVAYIPIGHIEGNQLDKKTVLTALSAILESENYPKAFQNTKFDRLIFKHQGINLKGVVFDTMLASYVFHPEYRHNLGELCQRYLPEITAQSYKELGIAKGKTIADLSIDIVANYCGMDAYATFNLVPILSQELKTAPQLYQLLLEVEQPLEPVLSEMENTGIKINTKYLKELSQQLAKELHKIEAQAYQEAEETFNLSSPKQLGVILFEKLGLDKQKTRKTKTGYSTNHATLEKLRGDHPIIDSILEYRTLSKLKSTYVDALPALVHPQTQRVHTTFNQTVTTTGRLSSSDPNLQNIPIRTEFSRQIRQAFIPEDNWLLVSADYSQIELRILAHFSQEPVLLEAYNQNQDVHRVTAQLLFDKEDITPLERNLGKTINFGVIYGMGAQRFAREAGMSSQEGKRFIDKYRRRYAQVFNYLENTKKEAIAQGFVTTILGRRRYFELGDEKLKQFKGQDSATLNLDDLEINYMDAQLLRAAANAPIQGSSADIIKIAMIKLAQILKDYQARLLLQVHDELVFEIPTEEWTVLEAKIKTTMEEAVKLTVPLKVEIHTGSNWMEAK